MPDSNGTRRIRVSVPATDKAVLAWLDAQNNMSVSVREAIKYYISKHGFGDAFASEVPASIDATAEVVSKARRRGRKPRSSEEPAQTAVEVLPQPAPQVQPAAEDTVPKAVESTAKPASTVAKSPPSRRRSQAPAGKGIQLNGDAFGDFGVELLFEDEEETQDSGQTGSAVQDDIMNMMSEG